MKWWINDNDLNFNCPLIKIGSHLCNYPTSNHIKAAFTQSPHTQFRFQFELFTFTLNSPCRTKWKLKHRMWCRDLSCTTLIIRSFFAALIALVLQKCIQMKIFCCFNLWAVEKLHVKSPLLPSDGRFYLWQQVNNCITSTILTSLTYYKNKRAIGISAIARESFCSA